jgi:hypothetical protein
MMSLRRSLGADEEEPLGDWQGRNSKLRLFHVIAIVVAIIL